MAGHDPAVSGCAQRPGPQDGTGTSQVMGRVVSSQSLAPFILHHSMESRYPTCTCCPVCILPSISHGLLLLAAGASRVAALGVVAATGVPGSGVIGALGKALVAAAGLASLKSMLVSCPCGSHRPGWGAHLGNADAVGRRLVHGLGGHDGGLD